MTNDELRQTLEDLSLRQNTFAKLLGVTPRAVTLWLSGERAVPAPVVSYLRLFEHLPPNLRQAELETVLEDGRKMREGMYAITFRSGEQTGAAVLVFENGRIYGVDTGAVRYDGGYTYDPIAESVDAVIRITFPPDVEAVFGVRNPYEWSYDVTAKFNPNGDSGDVEVETSLGQAIEAQYAFLRALPNSS